MNARELKFKTTLATVTISYTKATNKEYEQYYKENIDSEIEVDDDDIEEYDGYIVIVGDGAVPEWYSKTEFFNTFINIETED